MQLVESSDEERAERKKDEESAERWKAGASARTSERRFGSHGILRLRSSSEHGESMILQAAAATEADKSEADKKTPEEEGKNVAEGGETVAEDKNGISPTPILTQKCPIKIPEIIPNYRKCFSGRARMISFLFVGFQIPDFQILKFSRLFSNGLGPGPSLGRAWAELGPGLGQAWAWVLGRVKSGPRAWMCTPGLINSRRIGFEKSQILGRAWAGLG